MRDIRDGSYLAYPNVMNVDPDSDISFRVASDNPGGATIEVRTKDPAGELLGTCRVAATGGWAVYQTAGCKLKNRPGKLDLCLVFKGGAGEILRMQAFQIGE